MYEDHICTAAKIMAETMKNAHIPMYGARLRLPDRKAIIALLKEASKKYEQTIIMITHSRSIAQTADRVLRVSDGSLTDFGRCRG